MGVCLWDDDFWSRFFGWVYSFDSKVTLRNLPDILGGTLFVGDQNACKYCW